MLGAQFFIHKSTPLMTYTTLSERLKQAGIKESKPECDGKLRKNKNSKKSRSLGFSYNEKYVKNKKFPNPKNNYVLPYGETSPNEDFNKKSLSSKNSSSENMGDNVEVNQKDTTFVFLDFIEDCQNYRKKVRTPKENKERKRQGMCPRNFFINEKQHSERKVKPKKAHCKISSHSGSMKKEKKFFKNKTKEKNYFFKNKKKEPRNLRTIVHSADTEKENLKSQTQKVSAETIQHVQPLFDKLSSDNVAKIDKKYLQSLLSIATGKKKISNGGESKESADEGEGSEATTEKAETRESQPEKKIKKAKVQDESLQNISKNQNFVAEKKTEWNDASYQNSNTRTTRIVRDLTKSEEQLQINKGDNTYSLNNSTIIDKNVTLSKPDLKDIRKKRKLKNKYRKTSNYEYIETSFPSEVSKVVDIKELWRRNVQKKSDNSLSSISSCTVPESDEFPGIKNLDSYKMLKQLVEEEIKKIMRKPKNKIDYNKQTEQKENNLNLESPKELGEMENINKALRQPLLENSNNKKPNEVSLWKKKQIQADTKQCISIYEKKKQKSHLRSILADDIPKEANPNWKLRNKKGSDVKIPNKTVENWSILRRLEQAFLALGTPTFPNENVKSSNAKNSKQQQEKKKHEKNILGSRNSKCREEISTKAMQSSQNNKVKSIKIKERPSKEKLLSNKMKKESVKKNSTKSNSITPFSNESQKTIDLSQNVKKGTNAPQAKENKLKLGKTKNISKVALPNANQKKIIPDNLERKPTFKVISAKDSPVVQPRKTKSCEKNENIHFPVTNNTECKTEKHENIKEEPKIRSRSIDNERNKLASSTLPRRLAKNPVKEKPLQTFEKPKSKSEKVSIKGIVETSMSSSKSHFIKERTVPTVKKSKHVINNPIAPDAATTAATTTATTAAITAATTAAITAAITAATTTINTTTTNPDTNISESNNEYKYESYQARNCVTDRAIKKRSILSLQRSNLDTLQLFEEQENLSCPPLPLNNENCPSMNGKFVKTLHTKANTFHNNSSFLCTEAGSNDILQSFLNKNSDTTVPPHSKISQMIHRTSNSHLKQNSNTRIGESNTLRIPSWEKDISYYNTIVKEIMSQYKRIDGFLKQTEKSNKFDDVMTKADTKTQAKVVDPHTTNLDTYRKKIISEYQAVPIFEYKTKLEEAGRRGKIKRNLSVAKDYRRYVDVDVKDYQPKVKKILDSQLYVEPKNLIKQNDPKVKPTEKKSSLQEMPTCKNEKITHQDEKLRSFSMTKTYLEQKTPLILSSNHQSSSTKIIDDI